MSASGSGTRSVATFVCAVALVALAAMVVAGSYLQQFSAFERYDDEGYLMLSVRHVLDGHRLYDDIRVTYGPFYYAVRWLLHGPLHVPLSHDGVRLTALAARLLTAGLAAAVVHSTTRHVGLAALALLLVTIHMNVVAREPGHPQELAAVLGMGTLLGARHLTPSRALRVVGVLGLLTAATAMLKLNLGLFAGLAIWLAVLASLPRRRETVLVWRLSVVLAAGLPLALAHQHLAEPWCLQLIGCATASVVGVAALAAPRADGELRRAHLVVLVLAVLAGVAAIVLPVLLRHASLAMAYDRVAEGARLMTQFFVLKFLEPTGAIAAAATGTLLAAVAGRGTASARRRAAGWALVKAVVGVTSVVTVVINLPEALIGLAAPFAWLVLVPTGGRGWTPAERSFRLVLAWLAVLEPLQVYPVAGSQRFVGGLALVVCGLVELGDAFDRLAERRSPDAVRRLTAPALLAATLLLARAWMQGPWIAYDAEEPLALPGATLLHVPSDEARDLRALVATLRARCHPFATYAGFNSLYFWTEQAPPTLDLVPHEIRLVVPERQRALVAALAASPTSCFVRVPSITGRPLDPTFRALLAPYFAVDNAGDPGPIAVGDVLVYGRR